MALTMNVSASGKDAVITWSGAMKAANAYSVTIKRFPAGTVVGEDFDDGDFAQGTAVGNTHTEASGSVTDSSTSALTSYVYVIYDGCEEEYYAKDVTTGTTLTADASAHSGNEIEITWNYGDGIAPVTVYRGTEGGKTAADSESLTRIGSGTDPSGSVHDYTASPGTTYYYYAKNGNIWAAAPAVTTPNSGEFKPDFEPKHIVNANQTNLIVSNQNTYGAVNFSLPADSGNIAVIMVKTSSPLTDADLADLFNGTDDKFQILAQDHIDEVEGKSVTLDGRLHFKYQG